MRHDLAARTSRSSWNETWNRQQTSFQVRGLLALRAASTACWKWCNRTSVLARRPQLGMCTKMMRAASYSCASKHLAKEGLPHQRDAPAKDILADISGSVSPSDCGHILQQDWC